MERKEEVFFLKDLACQFLTVDANSGSGFVDGKVRVGLSYIYFAYLKEVITKRFPLIYRVSYREDDIYYTIEVLCKDFQRIVFRVAKLKELSTECQSQKGIHGDHLKKILNFIEEGFHHFGIIPMGHSVPAWSLQNELLRQGYKLDCGLLKVVEFNDYRLILPSAVSVETLSRLSNFHYKKIPSYSWGCWNPASPYFGCVILMGGRPATALGEDLPKITYSMLSENQPYKEQYESFDLLYSYQQIVHSPEIFAKSHKKKPFVIFDNGIKTQILTEMFKNFQLTSQKCFYDEIESKCNALFNEALGYQFHQQSEFLNSVDGIKWYVTIIKYLSVSKQLSKSLKKQGGILYIQNAGPECGDTNLIILSLIQIFVDPYYRTINGFCGLIFKDWVYFREENVSSEKPWWGFFTFLSCLYDLMLLNMEHFEFNTNFLTVLMDMVYTTKVTSSYSLKEKDSSVSIFEEELKTIFSLKDVKNMEYKEDLISDLKIFKNDIRISRFLWYDYMLRYNPSYSSILSKQIRPKIFWSYKMKSLALSNFAFFLPPLSGLGNITSLDLNKGSLSQLPHEIRFMTNLSSLAVEHNCLRKFPSFVGEYLTNLVEIRVSHNYLRDFPSLPKLNKMCKLVLDSNNINNLDTIPQLQNLFYLSVASNKINNVPIHFKLTNLTELNLDGNSLVHPPSYLFLQCYRLKVITLSKSQIVVLPDVFHSLPLFNLDLMDNSICHIPVSLFLLSNLQNLNLSQNQLTVVPELIGQLTHLKTLNLSKNKLKALPPTMKNLVLLENLELKGNELEEIPSWCHKLRILRTMDVSENKIQKVSASVCQMNQLRTLDLSKNCLKELPLSLGLLSTTLQDLYIDKEVLGNEMQTGNTRSILDSLSERLTQKIAVNRMKVVFIGPEQSGKTKLLEAIKMKWIAQGGEEYSISRTEGMDVHNLQFLTRRKKEKAKLSITASLWDFKGKTVYESLQQFFFSSNAIYILVFNIASPDPIDKQLQLLAMWIRSIKTRVSSPKLLIVATHTDKLTSKTLNEKLEYFRSKLNFVGFKFYIFDISLLDPSPNISPLTKEIEGRVSDANIKSSFELMEALLKEHANESNVPILNFNDLMRIGALCHLTNSAEIKACVRTLHRSGSIIFYEGIKELQEVVILDPKWLFEVMATFFTANDSFLKDGVVDPKNLKHIWTSYPEEIYPKLVLLLESFDLIISIEQNLNTLLKVIKTSQETDVTPPISLCSLSSTDNPFSKTSAILVPSFLPKNRPNKLIEKIWDNQPEGMPQISRIFRFTFLPNGIFQRFVSRLLHLHTDVLLTTLWSNGAIVSLDSIINVFVQQVTDSSDGIGLEENDIFIEVRSKDKHYMRDIFHELCSELIRIASSWESISWTRHVVFPQMTGEVKKINVETVVDQLEINGGLEGYDGISISNIVPEIMVSNYQGPRIDLKNIKLGKELGEGGFARVKEGISAKNEVYAVKIMNFDASSKKNTSRENDDALSSFRKEVMLQSKLKHPNILSLLAIGVNPHCMYFELCKLGNLHDYKNNLLLPLQWKVKLKIALDIAQAMDYLHSQEPPIAHLDLKSPNVLLQTDPQSQFQIISKVSDFGTALAVRGPIRIRYVENPTWLAPEIIQGQGYREDVDVYAFGLILWEIITRCELFADEDHASTIQDKIISGDRPRIPKECPVELRNLITACWSSDPNSRPKWKQIILTINELFLTEDKEDIVFSREKQSKSTLAVIPDRTITIEETTVSHNDSPETEEDKIRSSSRFKRILRGSFLEKSGKEPLAMRNCFEDLYNDKNAFNSFKEYLKSGGGDFSTDCLDYHKLVHKYKKTGSSKYSQKITAFLMKEDTVAILKWSGGKKIFNEHTNTMNLVGVNLEELFIEISSTFEKELEQRILNWKKTDMRKKSVVKKKDIHIISSEPASPLVQKWTMDGSKRKLAASTRNFFSMRTKPMDLDEMKTRQEFEEYCIQNGLNHNFHCYKMITDSSSSSVSTLTQIHFQFLAPSLLILPPNTVIEKIQLLYSQGLTEEKEQEARSVLQELKSLLLEDSIKKGTKERNIT